MVVSFYILEVMHCFIMNTSPFVVTFWQEQFQYIRYALTEGVLSEQWYKLLHVREYNSLYSESW